MACGQPAGDPGKDAVVLARVAGRPLLSLLPGVELDLRHVDTSAGSVLVLGPWRYSQSL